MLYPPYIEGKLPAQFGDTLRIPFSFNKAGGFPTSNVNNQLRLKIRTMSTNINPLSQSDALLCSSDFGDGVVRFDIADLDLKIGQYYKIQLQLYDAAESESSPFSTIAVFKYTEPGQASINSLKADSINSNITGTVIGKYDFVADRSERVIEYKFTILSNGKEIDSTGWQLHNSQTDELTYAYDEYQIKIDTEDKSLYKIIYSVRTSNGLEISSPHYLFQNQGSFPLNLSNEIEASAVNNYSYGCIEVVLKFTKACNLFGEFLIYRREEGSKYWEHIGRFLVDKMGAPGEKIIGFTDSNVIQGVKYTYAIAQTDSSMDNQLTTDRLIIGKDIQADFEDMFLWDMEKKLRLRYNPQVTSFKTTIQETKTDTIGGMYPHFFRNGRSGYKEFPISALLSFTMDMEPEEYGQWLPDSTNNEVNQATDLTSYTIAQERKYKMAVLDWLNNGKPKVFTSPTEGKYLVRLSNVSLSPNETLGRMLHTFSATAYEVGLSSYDELDKIWGNKISVELLDNLKIKEAVLPNENAVIDVYDGVQARVLKAPPGTILKFHFKDDSSSPNITIGATGYYDVFIEPDNPLIKIQIDTSKQESIQSNLSISDLYNSNAYVTTDKDIVIEYAYLRAPRYGLVRTFDDKEYYVNSVQYHEIIKQVHVENGNSYDIASIPNLANILYVRIQVEDDWLNEAKFSISFSEDGTDIVDIDLTGGRRIEYNAKEFGGVFLPKQLILHEGVYADIYYGTLEYEKGEVVQR